MLQETQGAVAPVRLGDVAAVGGGVGVGVEGSGFGRRSRWGRVTRVTKTWRAAGEARRSVASAKKPDAPYSSLTSCRWYCRGVVGDGGV